MAPWLAERWAFVYATWCDNKCHLSSRWGRHGSNQATRWGGCCRWAEVEMQGNVQLVLAVQQYHNDQQKNDHSQPMQCSWRSSLTGSAKKNRWCRSQSKQPPCWQRQRRWGIKKCFYGGTAHGICSRNSTLQPCPALPNNRALPQLKRCSRHLRPLLVATIPTIGTSLSGDRREEKSMTSCPKNYTMYVSPPKISRLCVVSLMAKCHNFGTKTNYGEPNIWAYLSWSG